MPPTVVIRPIGPNMEDKVEAELSIKESTKPPILAVASLPKFHAATPALEKSHLPSLYKPDSSKPLVISSVALLIWLWSKVPRKALYLASISVASLYRSLDRPITSKIFLGCSGSFQSCPWLKEKAPFFKETVEASFIAFVIKSLLSCFSSNKTEYLSLANSASSLPIASWARAC